MRLLRLKSGDDFELITFNTDDLPSYAILSHTWTDGEEITYNELVAGTGKDKAGYTKIRFCGERAAQDGLQYFWVDTCCINKSTSDELSMAINSMFRWYQRASKCYVYMADVQVPEEVTDVQVFRITWEDAFRGSRWFTRGWTLQELLAPASVEFFSKEGKRLGSKISLEQEIHEVTQVPVRALQGQRLSEFSVDERMSWIARRRTTVKEDKAYCLLGIFGVFMPLIYGEGEEHAYLRLRRKLLKSSKEKEVRDNDHTSGLPDQSTQLRPSSNVPFRRDDDFVDRGDLLTRIDQRCSRPAGRAALVGFGGFGKSQLAIEYAYRVRQRSPDTWVFWVHASNSARLEAAFSNIAEKVGLSSQPDAAVDTLQVVRRWLCNESNGRWLMIVDNVDTDVVIEVQKEKEKVSLASLLPQTDHGAILITSRNADIARSLVGREKDIIAVEAMSDDEAVQLLGNNLGDKSKDGAIRLVSTLDCIPLAIVQAAAYINRLGPRMSVTKYLEELKTIEKQAHLLYKTAIDLRRDEQASNSVLMTWQISFDYICQKRPSAAYLLSFMSFFNRQGIPEFMIRHYTDKDSEGQNDSSGRRFAEEDVDFEEDVAVLRAFSLVRTTQRGYEFEMHGLVQLATRVWLRSTDTERKWYRVFIQAMAQEFPDGEYANWPKCQTLFPHVLSVAEQEDSNKGKTYEWALLLNNAGWYAWRQGLLAQAEDMVSKALEIRKEVLDADNLSTLLSSSLLGTTLVDSGKYEAAESMHRQTLAMYEK
ncbi:HET-domain-containing protein, partial [Lepidopterella palustris CBS 459.81]